MSNSQQVRPLSVVPIRAHMAGIEVVGDLNSSKKSLNTRQDHFVTISVDDREVAKSGKKPRVPAPRWEWEEDHHFLVHPSSTVKVTIYRKGRFGITKALLGRHTGKVIELLENDDDIALKDRAGTEVALKIKIKLSLISTHDDFESLMESVGDDVSRLAPAGISALGKALYFTKNIMDTISDAHPILKVSSTVISSVYRAVQQTDILDNSILDLAESLQEMLGAAKERPGLLLIKGTTNVIEEIGRTSLKVVSLIHEYTRPTSFIRRTLKSQLSENMKSRITQCQKSCNDLKAKFDRRVNMDTNRQLHMVKDDQLAKEIYRWLSAPDSSQNYNEACEKHQKDTCSWLLNGERFRQLQEKADLLWIKGTAGCGKTILCSSVIQRITELHEDAPIAYFFFDGRDGQHDLQTHNNLIRSLILQLSLQCGGIPDALVKMYGHGQQQPSTKFLQETLLKIIEGLDSVYIIVDSLDECIEREKLLAWISDTVSRQMDNLHMVVASRPERDISETLQSIDTRNVDVVEEVNQDIEIYLEKQLALVKKWDQETLEIVKSRLMERAHGMFRWVALQLMQLQKCSNRHSVMQQLNSLPRGLHHTYGQILLKIDNLPDHTDTKTLLRWLCFSNRPMTLKEIAETILVDLDAENGPQYAPLRRYWDEQDVLDKCSGFITESKGRVKLAHFSVKEYLISEDLRMSDSKSLSSFHLIEEHSHSLISQTCLVYLLQLDTPDSLDQNVITSFPLACYAAEYWIFHARSGDIDKSGGEPSFTLMLAQNLFTPGRTAFTNWVRIWDLERSYRPMDLGRRQTDIPTPLYYASYAGLQRISQHLLQKGVDVNAKGGLYNTALQAASYRGHETIVKLLLENRAEVNAQGGEYANALQAASYQGHDAIVELLIEKGADVNMQGGLHGNALQAASRSGHKSIAEQLLEKGADVKAQGGRYGNAIQAASFGGNEAIVQLLLERGADPDAQGGQLGSAIQAASRVGDKAIVELLLEKGAQVNAQGGHYGNALQAASYKGHDAIAKLLLERGADVNVQGGAYGSALQAASRGQNEGIVKLLLETGVDANAQGGYYGNALQGASYRGSEAIVKLLLEKGVDVNAAGGKYGNALQAAALRGHDKIVGPLLERGADVNAQGGEYGNALQAASFSGDEMTVKLLLEKGADVNAQGGRFANALQAASSKGHKVVVALLLEKGAETTVLPSH